jgi:cytochrome c biogenesis protein
VNLPDGAVLSLTDFRFERYPDGRPKDWTSVLDLADKDGKPVKEKFELRVNNPLRYGGFTFYQASYTPYHVLELRSRDGQPIELYQGEEIRLGDTAYYFMALTADTRAVIRVEKGGEAKVVRAAPGDAAGELSVAAFKQELATGIQAVRDPGYALVLPAMLLVALGTALTFIRKIKEGV